MQKTAAASVFDLNGRLTKVAALPETQDEFFVWRDKKDTRVFLLCFFEPFVNNVCLEGNSFIYHCASLEPLVCLREVG